MAGAAGAAAAGAARPGPAARRRRRPGRELAVTGRAIATLVIVRFQLPHAALAVFCGARRCTITGAAGEIRPLPAARGFAVPGQPGLG